MYPKSYFAEHQLETQNATCFVLMPFAQRFSAVYDAIVDALQGDELNFTCKRADDFFGGGHIMEDVLRSIAESEIIIADVTTKNPNVFYELGIAHIVKDIEKVLIVTQSMDDVPFDVRQLRCIVYEQSDPGIAHLRHQLVKSVQEISKASFRFSVADHKSFKFGQRLLGAQQRFYHFEIPEVWVGIEAARFHIQVFRHSLGHPIEMISEKPYGIHPGDSIPFDDFPWKLKLDKVIQDMAYFSLIPK
jgi:hypothetical protein